MSSAPWVKEVDSLSKELGVDVKKGLEAGQVTERLEEFGYNELEKEEGRSFLELVLEQFEDPLVKILLVAAVISAVIAVSEAYEAGHALTIDKFVEPLVILLILVLNAIVGVYQESNAEKSLEALKDMQPDVARVLRCGEWVAELPARELVPGDIVELRVGDKVPADCRVAVLKTTTLRLEQMALTGESVAVSKFDEPISKVDCEIQSKGNMLFAGTTLANGHCLCIVTHTGIKTEIGKIQEQIQAAAAARSEEKTPLKQKLEEFSDMLQWIISAVCLLVWLINFRMFVDLETMSFDYKKCIYYFQIAVALAVAAIPEGLPAVITMCLALGTRKMAARNSIVRKLPAVETLGCTSVICSDKTGTLTTNQMSVREMVTLGSSETNLISTSVTGSTYNPFDGQVEFNQTKLNASLEKLAQICAVCNESTVEFVEGKGYKHIGAPTEAALTVLVEKMYQNKNEKDFLNNNKQIRSEAPNVATLEFTRDRKSMSVIVSTGKTRSRSNQLLVKGAPETLLTRCTHAMLGDGRRVALTDSGRKEIEQSIQKMAGKAWRCLGFAFSQDLGDLSDFDGPHHPGAQKLRDPENFVKVEQQLTFVGLVAMQDPPRQEVAQAMKECSNAGIRVIVITGDNKITAEAICRDIGVFEPDEDITKKSFIGHDFSKFSTEKQKALLLENRLTGMVFSRAEPKFKQDIVMLLKEAGDVVAMTGDGVNDAPALKLADIGIAMGLSGTEVAKEASDMVLADDNFSTIVEAVEEGRSIYNNMRAFIRYMISSNIGEVASIFFTAALGMPEGMAPIQLLWVNLVTDGPPATALSFNPSDPDIMEKPPRNKNEPLISNWVLFRYIVVGMYVGFATVGSFASWFMHGVGSEPFLGFLDLSQDGHSAVTLEQLMNWNQCNTTTNMFQMGDGKSYPFKANSWTAGDLTYTVNGCDYFGDQGKLKASTISLSVLVTIEMFNALNAVSEDGSLLAIPPWVNPYLIIAMIGSFLLHFAILYIPPIAPMFDVVPLSQNEWILVLIYSFPVILIDEVLKFIGRTIYGMERSKRQQAISEAKKKK